MSPSRSLLTLSCIVLGACLIACERQPTLPAPSNPGPATVASSALPADLFVATAPAGARSVGALKTDPQAAGEVIIHGRIGGRVEPFVKGAAVFLLADAGMKSCRELHEDQCPTPWDYCCEPKDSLNAKTATVQIVDADGRPLRLDLQGQHGLVPLAELTIVGEVAQRGDTGALVINARKIHVAPPRS